ncbi:ABC transporter permease [Candidatus Acetothermia bacterium]|nr:ABC transporter permease [Candidatus Acetothermia bacterium]MBI3642603.1 ABC transporter permease [Candidatus Acetothermia bacterium]
MLGYLLRRAGVTLALLALVSVIAFAVIKLMPGDYLTQYQMSLPAELLDSLREQYGLDQPPLIQYGRWVSGIVTALDFGYSFENQRPVLEVLFTSGDRLFWSLILLLAATITSFCVALPLAIYSATHPKGIGSMLTNGFSLLGISIPNFLTALLLLYVLVSVLQVGQLGLGVAGLFDPQYVDAPWSWEKLLNLLWHLWPAVLVISFANIAVLARYLRAQLLEVLSQPYIQVARSKGISERVVLWRHALRNALNPVLSLMGFWLPSMFESTLVAAVILQLPIVEGAFWQALGRGDQYVVLAGLIFFSVVLFVGNFISDILLAWSDPKIRYE